MTQGITPEQQLACIEADVRLERLLFHQQHAAGEITTDELAGSLLLHEQTLEIISELRSTHVN